MILNCTRGCGYAVKFLLVENVIDAVRETSKFVILQSQLQLQTAI